MAKITYSRQLQKLLNMAANMAAAMRHDFVTPEHLLRVLLNDSRFLTVLGRMDIDPEALKEEMDGYLGTLDRFSDDEDRMQLEISNQLHEILAEAHAHLEASERSEMDIPHIIARLLDLEDSTASYALHDGINGREGEFMSEVIEAYGPDGAVSPAPGAAEEGTGSRRTATNDDTEDWHGLVTCVNDSLDGRNPLIGREEELARTIRVLCRKDKNNPLHIGEPGVGKTALVYGLARMINEGRVPERLRGARIYSLELGGVLAGTQYRGEFEKRLKAIMDGASREENAIIYIDEIHNLVGAGATGQGSMDASNMLKPYLEGGRIRFIGSTTYDEYKRHFERSKGLVRRFSPIEVAEPSIEEAIKILDRLRPSYESYHGVTYLPEAIEYAVTGSARHIADRCLPDKAIDLIDEAGATLQANGAAEGAKTVDREMIAETLAKACKVDAVSMRKDSIEALATLQERVEARLYGQDEAVRAVVEAVQMSKAGLSDPDKPLASLLFVGPTGVGKTELAKSLADELGIGLVRFDMSEYAEKHSVAKLIGSPAGYVGYDDGGLLTDAIRKTPDCVLLLDEIEKAHPDIYNILLQVMDYGKLTDNKGRRADFRNVVLIMTSNAGARYAAQASVGFASTVTAGSAMLKQVKKTFQPEFLNRLSATVVFNDMDRHMASLILDRKLGELEASLRARNVTLHLSPEGREYLLSEGYSREYGAREMDRVIAASLKPLLMRELLFGRLRDGGHATVGLADGKLLLDPRPS